MRMELVKRHGRIERIATLEKALLRTCPVPCREVRTPTHRPDVLLVMYGAGAPTRTEMMRRHRSAGGRVLCFDLGYFGRENHYRAAIDHLHVMPKELDCTADDASRFEKFGITLREDSSANGQVVVVGLGMKSRIGLNVYGWEKQKLSEMQRRFPLHQIVYRPKARGARLKQDGVTWAKIDAVSPIESVLRGASLVVSRHSNVCVDACIAGIPVECEDGAARWLYSSTSSPNEAKRKSFLNRLAWWNWNAAEMSLAWKFLMPKLMVQS